MSLMPRISYDVGNITELEVVNVKSDDISNITPGQVRAARAFLRWTAQELADAASIGVATVRRAELQNGALGITAANAKAMRAALEVQGIEFLDGDAPGVRLHQVATAG